MKIKMRRAAFITSLLGALAIASAANASAFCDGWAAGWKSAFDNRRLIPAITPICPIPQIGQDTFQGGYEAGLLAALRQLGN